MRISKQDLKAGIIRVKIENADDLWILRGVLQPGDEVGGSTERKIKIGNAKDEKSNVVRKRIRLRVKVEKVEYANDGSSLRALGTISDGPEDVPRGEHHTFSLEPGVEVTIKKKEWPGYLIAKVKEATKEDASLLVLLFDREEAKLYKVTRRGVKEVQRLKGVVVKKELDNQKATNFYKELVVQLKEQLTHGTYHHIVAGAPAFWKEYLQKELPPELKKLTVMTTISAVERTAIRELLARPEVGKLLAESSTMRELQLVENALGALAKELLAYGDKEVAETILAGNAAHVLLTENEIVKRRENGSFHKLEELLKAGERTKATIHVLSSEEAQTKIDPLGGLVAIKRW